MIESCATTTSSAATVAWARLWRAEFRSAGVPCVVLDSDPAALAAARERRRAVDRGLGHEDEDLEAAGIEQRTRARRMRRAPTPTTSSSRSPLARCGPTCSIVARASDRRRRAEAAARRSRPGHAAVRDRRQRDGEARAPPAGGRVPRQSSRRRGPDVRLEEIEVTPASGCPPDRTIRDLRLRHETGALVIARPAAGRLVRDDAEPRRRARRGRRDHRRRHRRRAGCARAAVRSARDRCRLRRSAARGRARASSPARRSSSSVPRRTSTATTRRTSRCARAGAGNGAPREIAEALAAKAAASPQSSERRWPARASSTSGSQTEWFGGRARGDPRGRIGVRRRARPPRYQRIQVEAVSANPTGPVTVGSARNGAYGDSVARLLGIRRPRRRARVLLQRRRSADRRCSASRSRHGGGGRSRLRTATTGAYVEEIARARGRPGGADDGGRSRRSSSSSASTSTPGPARPIVSKGIPARARADRHVRGRGHALGADDGVRRRQGPAARPLVGRRLPLLRRRRRVRRSTSSPVASTGRSTCSAPITTATSGV